MVIGMGDLKSLSTVLYSNQLDIKKFENLLSNNDQGYKFFWLEAIMKLIPNDNDYFTFEDVIKGNDKIINDKIWALLKSSKSFE